MKHTPCRSCKAPMVWTITRTGKRMPVDAEPAELGLFYLREEADGNLHAYNTMSQADQPEPQDGLRYTSHYATCPDAEQWRKR